MPVPAAPPEPLAETALTPGDMSDHTARLLPLSDKAPAALRDLAARYLVWPDGRSEELSSGAESASVLADIAWTAGVGRSHFPHPRGVPFSGLQSLRAGLRSFADADSDYDAPPPQPASSVAFLFDGNLDRSAGIVSEIYDTESTARAILDFCDVLVRQEQGASL